MTFPSMTLKEGETVSKVYHIYYLNSEEQF
jgi:hypothetical protein